MTAIAERIVEMGARLWPRDRATAIRIYTESVTWSVTEIR